MQRFIRKTEVVVAVAILNGVLILTQEHWLYEVIGSIGLFAGGVSLALGKILGGLEDGHNDEDKV